VLPSNITLDLTSGARFTVKAGVTFSGNIDALPWQYVFDLSGTGTISLYNTETFPQWFGAVDSSVGDSTTAIQLAISALPFKSSTPVLTRHGHVRFIDGSYKIGGHIQVPLGVGLIHDYPSNTPININDRSGARIFVSTTTGNCISFNGAYLKGSGCYLKGLKFIGGGGSSTTVVYLDQIFDMTIEDLSFESMNVGNCIMLDTTGTAGTACNWVTIQNCTIKNIGDGYGSNNYTYGYGIRLTAAADCLVIENKVENCGLTGISVAGISNRVINNWSDLCNVGIAVQNGGLSTIRGNSTKFNKTAGVILYPDCTAVKIHDHVFENNNALNYAGTDYAHHLKIQGTGITGANLYFQQTDDETHGAKCKIGIFIDSGASANLYDLELNGTYAIAHYYDPNNRVGNQVSLLSKPFSLATANRPNVNTFMGDQGFDITLGKPIWRNKTNNGWVDSMGNGI
jgi:parallel beta-helix repeat protein